MSRIDGVSFKSARHKLSAASASRVGQSVTSLRSCADSSPTEKLSAERYRDRTLERNMKDAQNPRNEIR